MFSSIEPTTIQEGLNLHFLFLKETESEKKATEISNLTRTALTRYTLPGWGIPAPKGRKPTRVETGIADNYLQSTALKQLKEAIEVQERVFDECKATRTQRHTYGSKLANLVGWLKKQGWLDQENKPIATNCSPKIFHGYGRAADIKLTDRQFLPGYKLRENRMSLVLQQELEEFKNFLLADFYPQRETGKVSFDSTTMYLTGVSYALGWFADYKRKPLKDKDLTLKDLIRQPNNSQKDMELAANELDTWLCEYLQFLVEERNCRATSISNYLLGILALAKFQYLKILQKRKNTEIPVIGVITKKINYYKSQSEGQGFAVNQDLKWLDLPEVFSRVINPLREECGWRLIGGGKRPITVIATSFQDFIIWGMLTFRPPRRQREYRDMKISYFCPIEKPKGVKKGQVVHPLPIDRKKGENRYHTYLFKDLDEKWYLDASVESYKTGRSKGFGDQKLEIPNPSFSDGKCFYDYLEAFIYGYYRDNKGNWVSGGKSQKPLPGTKFYSLRMSLVPSHHHVFTQPYCTNFYSRSGFAHTFRHTANRLTGQQLTPHLLRDIFATWFLDQGYTEDRIESLAYAMGHSVKTLRNIYDRRRPKQKLRPIEETMTEIINHFVH
jgi:hypothetical protein